MVLTLKLPQDESCGSGRVVGFCGERMRALLLL